MKQEFIIINGQRIAYIKNIINEQKPVHVFFHGWMSNKESFAKIYAHIPNIIAFDFPFMGSSSSPEQPWELKNFAEITSVFLQKISDNTAYEYHLFVHSFGGRVLLKMHEQNLPILKWKSIICTGVPFYREKSIKIAVMKKINIIFSSKIFSWMKPTAKKIYVSIFSKDDYSTLGKNEVLKKTFQNIVNEDISQYLNYLQPYNNVKLIWGENDGSAPLKNAQKANKILSQSQLHIIKNAQHFPWIENEADFIEVFISSK